MRKTKRAMSMFIASGKLTANLGFCFTLAKPDNSELQVMYVTTWTYNWDLGFTWM